MTHGQALAECRRLEADEEGSGRWMPHEVAPRDWRPTRITGAGLGPRGELHTAGARRPHPARPDRAAVTAAGRTARPVVRGGW